MELWISLKNNQISVQNSTKQYKTAQNSTKQVVNMTFNEIRKNLNDNNINIFKVLLHLEYNDKPKYYFVFLHEQEQEQEQELGQEHNMYLIDVDNIDDTYTTDIDIYKTRRYLRFLPDKNGSATESNVLDAYVTYSLIPIKGGLDDLGLCSKEKVKTCKRKKKYPEWAKWKATDLDGCTYLYSDKPYISVRSPEDWCTKIGHDSIFLKKSPERKNNWKDTLRKIED